MTQKSGKRRAPFIWTALGVIVLLVLVWFFVASPAIGRRQWEAARAALLAKGEKLSMEDFPQPNLRDEENFFADPIWWEFSDMEWVDRGMGSEYRPRLHARDWQVNVFVWGGTGNQREALLVEFPDLHEVILGGSPRIEMERAWRYAEAEPARRARASALMLRIQEPVEPMIARLRELSKRPDALFPSPYGEGYFQTNYHTMALRGAAEWLAYRGKALIGLQDYRGAFREASLLFRLRETLRHEFRFDSVPSENLITQSFLDLVNHGIRAHAWTADELKAFEKMLEGVDGLGRLADVSRKQRAMMVEVIWPWIQGGGNMPYRSRFLNSGHGLWLYRVAWLPGDQMLYSSAVQQAVETLDAAPQKGLNARVFPDPLGAYSRKHSSGVSQFSKDLSMRFAPGLESMLMAARAQTKVNLTRVAIALERHRIDHGVYPESLAELAPYFPKGTPAEITTLLPFNYLRAEDGTFLLWSVGWNEINENGREEYQLDRADWAWGR